MRFPPDTACVFISHSTFDRKVADTLCHAIESRGLSCWIATRDIDPGDNYQEAIVQAIERSCAMVLIFSSNSNNSGEIKKEVSLASQNIVPIIPVRVEDVLPSGAFKYELSIRQFIDYFSDWEGAVEKIVGRIREITPKLDSVDQPSTTAASRLHRGARAGVPKRRMPIRAWAVGGVLGTCMLAAGAFAVTSIFRTGPQDLPARYPETAETRLNRFSFETPPQEVKAGPRRWRRVTSDRWIEEYPDGTERTLQVLERIHVRDCDGTKVSESKDESLQTFLPDRGCPAMTLLFRRLPNRDWIGYVQMDDAH